jgi:hypothetical protein
MKGGHDDDRLLAGTVQDAAGPGAVCADLAGAVPQVPGTRPRFAAGQPMRLGLAEPGLPLMRAITG